MRMIYQSSRTVICATINVSPAFSKAVGCGATPHAAVRRRRNPFSLKSAGGEIKPFRERFYRGEPSPGVPRRRVGRGTNRRVKRGVNRWYTVCEIFINPLEPHRVKHEVNRTRGVGSCVCANVISDGRAMPAPACALHSHIEKTPKQKGACSRPTVLVLYKFLIPSLNISVFANSTAPLSTNAAVFGSMGSLASTGTPNSFATSSNLLSPKIACRLPQSGHSK